MLLIILVVDGRHLRCPEPFFKAMVAASEALREACMVYIGSSPQETARKLEEHQSAVKVQQLAVERRHRWLSAVLYLCVSLSLCACAHRLAAILLSSSYQLTIILHLRHLIPAYIYLDIP